MSRFRLGWWIAVVALVGSTAVSSPTRAHGALATYHGYVSATGVSAVYTHVQIPVSGTLTASLDWDQPTAKLVLSLARRNPDGTWTWITSASGQKPESLSYPVTAGTWRLGAKAKLGAANYTLTVNTPDGPPDNAYVTLLFSRSEITTADNCVANDSGVIRLDTGVVPELARRGISGTGSVETGVTGEHSNVCLHAKSTLAASWDQLATLRDSYGWSFVSHSRTYATNWTTMTRDQQWNESCGSIRDLQAHGHMRGDGLFAYPNNAWNDDIQANVVSTCFAFGRKYGGGAATRTGVTTAPFYAKTQQVGGGRCADQSLPCSTLNVPCVYRSPELLSSQMTTLSPGNWMILQSYLLVDGARAGQWDCTSSDWHAHWANDWERYCWSDYLRILDAIPPSAIVTDPKTVAQAWGRTGYTPPS
jgi:hypothetical protein